MNCKNSQLEYTKSQSEEAAGMLSLHFAKQNPIKQFGYNCNLDSMMMSTTKLSDKKVEGKALKKQLKGNE